MSAVPIRPAGVKPDDNSCLNPYSPLWEKNVENLCELIWNNFTETPQFFSLHQQTNQNMQAPKPPSKQNPSLLHKFSSTLHIVQNILFYLNKSCPDIIHSYLSSLATEHLLYHCSCYFPAPTAYPTQIDNEPPNPARSPPIITHSTHPSTTHSHSLPTTHSSLPPFPCFWHVLLSHITFPKIDHHLHNHYLLYRSEDPCATVTSGAGIDKPTFKPLVFSPVMIPLVLEPNNLFSIISFLFYDVKDIIKASFVEHKNKTKQSQSLNLLSPQQHSLQSHPPPSPAPPTVSFSFNIHTSWGVSLCDEAQAYNEEYQHSKQILIPDNQSELPLSSLANTVNTISHQKNMFLIGRIQYTPRKKSLSTNLIDSIETSEFVLHDFSFWDPEMAYNCNQPLVSFQCDRQFIRTLQEKIELFCASPNTSLPKRDFFSRNYLDLLNILSVDKSNKLELSPAFSIPLIITDSLLTNFNKSVKSSYSPDPTNPFNFIAQWPPRTASDILGPRQDHFGKESTKISSKTHHIKDLLNSLVFIPVGTITFQPLSTYPSLLYLHDTQHGNLCGPKTETQSQEFPQNNFFKTKNYEESSLADPFADETSIDDFLPIESPSDFSSLPVSRVDPNQFIRSEKPSLTHMHTYITASSDNIWLLPELMAQEFRDVPVIPTIYSHKLTKTNPNINTGIEQNRKYEVDDENSIQELYEGIIKRLETIAFPHGDPEGSVHPTTRSTFQDPFNNLSEETPQNDQESAHELLLRVKSLWIDDNSGGSKERGEGETWVTFQETKNDPNQLQLANSHDITSIDSTTALFFPPVGTVLPQFAKKLFTYDHTQQDASDSHLKNSQQNKLIPRMRYPKAPDLISIINKPLSLKLRRGLKEKWEALKSSLKSTPNLPLSKTNSKPNFVSEPLSLQSSNLLHSYFSLHDKPITLAFPFRNDLFPFLQLYQVPPSSPSSITNHHNPIVNIDPCGSRSESEIGLTRPYSLLSPTSSINPNDLITPNTPHFHPYYHFILPLYNTFHQLGTVSDRHRSEPSPGTLLSSFSNTTTKIGSISQDLFAAVQKYDIQSKTQHKLLYGGVEGQGVKKNKHGKQSKLPKIVKKSLNIDKPSTLPHETRIDAFVVPSGSFKDREREHSSGNTGIGVLDFNYNIRDSTSDSDYSIISASSSDNFEPDEDDEVNPSQLPTRKQHDRSTQKRTKPSGRDTHLPSRNPAIELTRPLDDTCFMDDDIDSEQDSPRNDVLRKRALIYSIPRFDSYPLNTPPTSSITPHDDPFYITQELPMILDSITSTKPLLAAAPQNIFQPYIYNSFQDGLSDIDLKSGLDPNSTETNQDPENLSEIGGDLTRVDASVVGYNWDADDPFASQTTDFQTPQNRKRVSKGKNLKSNRKTPHKTPNLNVSYVNPFLHLSSDPLTELFGLTQADDGVLGQLNDDEFTFNNSRFNFDFDIDYDPFQTQNDAMISPKRQKGAILDLIPDFKPLQRKISRNLTFGNSFGPNISQNYPERDPQNIDRANPRFDQSIFSIVNPFLNMSTRDVFHETSNVFDQSQYPNFEPLNSSQNSSQNINPFLIESSQGQNNIPQILKNLHNTITYSQNIHNNTPQNTQLQIPPSNPQQLSYLNALTSKMTTKLKSILFLLYQFCLHSPSLFPLSSVIQFPNDPFYKTPIPHLLAAKGYPQMLSLQTHLWNNIQPLSFPLNGLRSSQLSTLIHLPKWIYLDQVPISDVLSTHLGQTSNPNQSQTNHIPPVQTNTSYFFTSTACQPSHKTSLMRFNSLNISSELILNGFLIKTAAFGYLFTIHLPQNSFFFSRQRLSSSQHEQYRQDIGCHQVGDSALPNGSMDDGFDLRSGDQLNNSDRIDLNSNALSNSALQFHNTMYFSVQPIGSFVHFDGPIGDDQPQTSDPFVLGDKLSCINCSTLMHELNTPFPHNLTCFDINCLCQCHHIKVSIPKYILFNSIPNHELAVTQKCLLEALAPIQQSAPGRFHQRFEKTGEFNEINSNDETSLTNYISNSMTPFQLQLFDYFHVQCDILFHPSHRIHFQPNESKKPRGKSSAHSGPNPESKQTIAIINPLIDHTTHTKNDFSINFPSLLYQGPEIYQNCTLFVDLNAIIIDNSSLHGKNVQNRQFQQFFNLPHRVDLSIPPLFKTPQIKPAKPNFSNSVLQNIFRHETYVAFHRFLLQKYTIDARLDFHKISRSLFHHDFFFGTELVQKPGKPQTTLYFRFIELSQSFVVPLSLPFSPNYAISLQLAFVIDDFRDYHIIALHSSPLSPINNLISTSLALSDDNNIDFGDSRSMDEPFFSVGGKMVHLKKRYSINKHSVFHNHSDHTSMGQDSFSPRDISTSLLLINPWDLIEIPPEDISNQSKNAVRYGEDNFTSITGVVVEKKVLQYSYNLSKTQDFFPTQFFFGQPTLSDPNTNHKTEKMTKVDPKDVTELDLDRIQKESSGINFPIILPFSPFHPLFCPFSQSNQARTTKDSLADQCELEYQFNYVSDEWLLLQYTVIPQSQDDVVVDHENCPRQTPPALPSPVLVLFLLKKSHLSYNLHPQVNSLVTFHNLHPSTFSFPSRVSTPKPNDVFFNPLLALYNIDNYPPPSASNSINTIYISNITSHITYHSLFLASNRQLHAFSSIGGINKPTVPNNDQTKRQSGEKDESHESLPPQSFQGNVLLLFPQPVKPHQPQSPRSQSYHPNSSVSTESPAFIPTKAPSLPITPLIKMLNLPIEKSLQSAMLHKVPYSPIYSTNNSLVVQTQPNELNIQKIQFWISCPNCLDSTSIMTSLHDPILKCCSKCSYPCFSNLFPTPDDVHHGEFRPMSVLRVNLASFDSFLDLSVLSQSSTNSIHSQSCLFDRDSLKVINFDRFGSVVGKLNSCLSNSLSPLQTYPYLPHAQYKLPDIKNSLKSVKSDIIVHLGENYPTQNPETNSSPFPFFSNYNLISTSCNDWLNHYKSTQCDQIFQSEILQCSIPQHPSIFSQISSHPSLPLHIPYTPLCIPNITTHGYQQALERAVDDHEWYEDEYEFRIKKPFLNMFQYQLYLEHIRHLHEISLSNVQITCSLVQSGVIDTTFHGTFSNKEEVIDEITTDNDYIMVTSSIPYAMKCHLPAAQLSERQLVGNDEDIVQKTCSDENLLLTRNFHIIIPIPNPSVSTNGTITTPLLDYSRLVLMELIDQLQLSRVENQFDQNSLQNDPNSPTSQALTNKLPFLYTTPSSPWSHWLQSAPIRLPIRSLSQHSLVSPQSSYQSLTAFNEQSNVTRFNLKTTLSKLLKILTPPTTQSNYIPWNLYASFSGHLLAECSSSLNTNCQNTSLILSLLGLQSRTDYNPASSLTTSPALTGINFKPQSNIGFMHFMTIYRFIWGLNGKPFVYNKADSMTFSISQLREQELSLNLVHNAAANGLNCIIFNSILEDEYRRYGVKDKYNGDKDAGKNGSKNRQKIPNKDKKNQPILQFLSNLSRHFEQEMNIFAPQTGRIDRDLTEIQLNIAYQSVMMYLASQCDKIPTLLKLNNLYFSTHILTFQQMNFFKLFLEQIQTSSQHQLNLVKQQWNNPNSTMVINNPPLDSSRVGQDLFAQRQTQNNKLPAPNNNNNNNNNNNQNIPQNQNNPNTSPSSLYSFLEHTTGILGDNIPSISNPPPIVNPHRDKSGESCIIDPFWYRTAKSHFSHLLSYYLPFFDTLVNFSLFNELKLSVSANIRTKLLNKCSHISSIPQVLYLIDLIFRNGILYPVLLEKPHSQTGQKSTTKSAMATIPPRKHISLEFSNCQDITYLALSHNVSDPPVGRTDVHTLPSKPLNHTSRFGDKGRLTTPPVQVTPYSQQLKKRQQLSLLQHIILNCVNRFQITDYLMITGLYYRP